MHLYLHIYMNVQCIFIEAFVGLKDRETFMCANYF